MYIKSKDCTCKIKLSAFGSFSAFKSANYKEAVPMLSKKTSISHPDLGPVICGLRSNQRR